MQSAMGFFTLFASFISMVHSQAPAVAVSQDNRGRDGGTIRCHVRNQYMHEDDDDSYHCPSLTGFAATQCFKLVCMGTSSSPNPFYIQKGCLDTSNVGAASCETLVGLCNGLGGGARGMCYTCSDDKCNQAPGLPLNKMPLLLPFLLCFIYSSMH